MIPKRRSRGCTASTFLQAYGDNSSSYPLFISSKYFSSAGIGFFAVSVASAVLPFALAFAGGTMLYVISDEMIPETHAHGSERGATYALLVGFCMMLITDVLLG